MGSAATHLTVSYHVQQTDDIRSTRKILQNLDFPLDLLLLDRFQYLNDALLARW